MGSGGDVQPHDIILVQCETLEHDPMKDGLSYDDARKKVELPHNYSKAVSEWLKKSGGA